MPPEPVQWLLTDREKQAIIRESHAGSGMKYPIADAISRAQLRKVVERIEREQAPIVGWPIDEHGVTHAATLTKEQWQQLRKEAGLEE